MLFFYVVKEIILPSTFSLQSHISVILQSCKRRIRTGAKQHTNVIQNTFFFIIFLFHSRKMCFRVFVLFLDFLLQLIYVRPNSNWECSFKSQTSSYPKWRHLNRFDVRRLKIHFEFVKCCSYIVRISVFLFTLLPVVAISYLNAFSIAHKKQKITYYRWFFWFTEKHWNKIRWRHCRTWCFSCILCAHFSTRKCNHFCCCRWRDFDSFFFPRLGLRQWKYSWISKRIFLRFDFQCWANDFVPFDRFQIANIENYIKQKKKIIDEWTNQRECENTFASTEILFCFYAISPFRSFSLLLDYILMLLLWSLLLLCFIVSATVQVSVFDTEKWNVEFYCWLFRVRLAHCFFVSRISLFLSFRIAHLEFYNIFNCNKVAHLLLNI